MFLQYVTNDESEVLKKALAIECEFDQDLTEKLLNILQNYDCKVLIKRSNFKTVWSDIAHKELIQKSMFIIDIWQITLCGLMSEQDLDDVCKKRQINQKNVLALKACRNIIRTRK